MKILIIGATGEAGRVITETAIMKGFDVSVFVRSPEKIDDMKKVNIIKGDILNFKSLTTSMKGIDVVISCVGAMDNTPGQVELFTSGMENIVLAMKNEGIKRLISINGALTKLKSDSVGIYLSFMRFLIPKLVPEMVNSNKAQYDVISHSDLDWTVIRAGKFVDKQTTGKTKISTSKQSGFNISVSKTGLAKFVISQIADIKYIKKSPMLFSI